VQAIKIQGDFANVTDFQVLHLRGSHTTGAEITSCWITDWDRVQCSALAKDEGEFFINPEWHMSYGIRSSDELADELNDFFQQFSGVIEFSQGHLILSDGTVYRFSADLSRIWYGIELEVKEDFQVFDFTPGGTSIQLSWTAPLTGADAPQYAVSYRRVGDSEWTSFGAASSSTARTITGLTSATSYDVRVVPTNCSDVRCVEIRKRISTNGLGTATFTVIDEDGFPLSGGEYSWISMDGRSASSKPQKATSLGVVTFTSVPAKPIVLSVVGGTTINGLKLTAEFTNLYPSSGNNLIRLPSVPTQIGTEVRVSLPTGDPVPNAKLESRYLSNQIQFKDGGVFDGTLTGGSTISTSTDASGVGVLTGWLDRYRAWESIDANFQVRAVLDDGILLQNSDWTDASENVELAFDYLPIIQINQDELTANNGSLTTLPVNVVDSAMLDSMPAREKAMSSSVRTGGVSGATISLVPPSNASQKKCGKKVVLKAKSKADGSAVLKFCATGSGDYRIQSVGAVAAGTIRVFVKGAAPLPPRSFSGMALNNTVTLAWAEPEYTGNFPLTGYTVTASYPGLKKAKVVKIKSGTTAFGSRSITIPGLDGKKIWNFKITATTKKGTSVSANTSVAVLGTSAN
jgi:hypothetical protein